MITGIRIKAITFNAKAPTLNRQLQILLPNSGQFDQNGQTGIGYENICVRNPLWLFLRLTTHVHNIWKNVGSASVRRPLGDSISLKGGASTNFTDSSGIRFTRSTLAPAPHDFERFLHADERRVSVAFVFDDVPLHARGRKF